MTMHELAAAAAAAATAAPKPDEATVTLSVDDALSIAETYTDACNRCHTLTQELAAQRAENVRLSNEAEQTRVHLAAALEGRSA